MYMNMRVKKEKEQRFHCLVLFLLAIVLPVFLAIVLPVLLAIVLSVLLGFTAFDYLFIIFKAPSAS